MKILPFLQSKALFSTYKNKIKWNTKRIIVCEIFHLVRPQISRIFYEKC